MRISFYAVLTLAMLLFYPGPAFSSDADDRAALQEKADIDFALRVQSIAKSGKEPA